MGETYTVRGTCACITFWKNSGIQISCSIMHRPNNLMHDMQPMYAQWLHQVWTAFGGMVQQTFICQHHASKCSPHPVQSIYIHWLHILHPILLPVHDRTRNLGFCIFLKCDACTCPSYRVSFPHILLNISLFGFLLSIPLQNKVWNIFAGTFL